MPTVYTKPRFPINREEMTGHCLQVAKARCMAMKKEGNFEVGRCLQSALDEFKRLYRVARKCRRNVPLTEEQAQELNGIYMDMWPDIERKIREMALDYATKYKVQQITKLTAEAAIREAMDEAGLDRCEVICQCYRAKVRVHSPVSKYSVTFIIKYKDIKAGKLNSLVAEFLKFNDALAALPFEVKVCK